MKASDIIAIMIFCVCVAKAKLIFLLLLNCVFLAQTIVIFGCIGFSYVGSYVLCSSIQDVLKLLYVDGLS